MFTAMLPEENIRCRTVCVLELHLFFNVFNEGEGLKVEDEALLLSQAV